MKTEVEPQSEQDVPISGDVIGDTAYSERFVLKLLLKFANLNTLQGEVQEKSFEDDLCTLWDMTVEKDVVDFLQKHKILSLFSFALPVIEVSRIIEIMIGIIGNMCCQKEVVMELFRLDGFLTTLMTYSKVEDSLILIQLLRLINSGLYLTEESDILIWMDLFKNENYPDTLYFILKNSSNKGLLLNALENLNTICSSCNIERVRSEFFSLFIKPEAMDTLSSGFVELTVLQSEACEKDELERVLVISLQICLNLVGFDNSPEIFTDNKEDMTTIIKIILDYYNNKIVNQNEIDMDLSDVIDSTNTIVSLLELSENCDLDIFFEQSYNMWLALRVAASKNINGSSNFEEDDKEQLQSFSKEIEAPICTLMCQYMERCDEDKLVEVMDKIGKDFYEIVKFEVKDVISRRTASYRSQLRDNVDS